MKKVRKIIGYLIMIIALIALIVVYRKYNFNNFEKSIKLKNSTNFVRDNEVKYSKNASYKVENFNYNDAMFSETIEVTPNTPYRVSCMVKTENLENEKELVQGGAHICNNITQERSKMLTGTNEWQELSFTFNSRNKTEVNIGFRVGGYETMSKGTVWFSDFKLEKGIKSNSNEWNMACFIFPNIDVNVNVNGKNEHVKLQMSDSDIATIETNLPRYKASIKEISNNQMSLNYETYIINNPINRLSYDTDNGYYVSASDVYGYINSYVEQKEYDYIYIVFRMADKQKGEDVLVSDWIGLGGMDYMGIGFSNIRMPDDRNNLVYEFNSNINTFPEEVFIHEFLHTLERDAKECGYDIPDLHDYAKYGYSEHKTEGLKSWYYAYMNREINYNGTKIGLPEEIYTCKPAHNSNFKYAISIDAFKDPSNIIELTQSIVARIQKLFKAKTNNKDQMEEILNNESFGL